MISISSKINKSLKRDSSRFVKRIVL